MDDIPLSAQCWTLVVLLVLIFDAWRAWRGAKTIAASLTVTLDKCYDRSFVLRQSTTFHIAADTIRHVHIRHLTAEIYFVSFDHAS